MERCANCERQIGNLETPHVYQGKVVCGQCWSVLQPSAVDYKGPATAMAVADPPMRKVQTVEATGKKWKAAQLIGVLSLIAGVGCIVAAFSNAQPGTDPAPLAGGGALLVIIGLPLYIAGRVGAWWFHG